MFSLDDRGRETDEPKKREDFRDGIKTLENSPSAEREKPQGRKREIQKKKKKEFGNLKLR